MNKCIIIIYLIVFCFSRVGGEEHLPMLVIKGNENMYPFNDDKDCYYESEFFMYSLLMVYRFNSKTASQNLIKELLTKTDSSGIFTKYIISSIKSSTNDTYTKCKEIEFDNIPLDSIKIIDPDALMYYKMIEYPDYLNSVKEMGDEKDYASLKDSLLEKCSDAGESFVFNYSTSALIFKAIESANNEKAYGYSYFYRFIKLWMTIRSVNMNDRMKLLCLNVLKMSAARGDEYAIREYERLINRPFHKVNASLQGSTIY